MRSQQVLCTMQLLLNLNRYPFFVEMIKPKFKGIWMQGLIQDFRKGGSNLQRGVHFYPIFLKFPKKNEIIWPQSGVQANPPEPPLDLQLEWQQIIGMWLSYEGTIECLSPISPFDLSLSSKLLYCKNGMYQSEITKFFASTISESIAIQYQAYWYANRQSLYRNVSIYGSSPSFWWPNWPSVHKPRTQKPFPNLIEIAVFLAYWSVSLRSNTDPTAVAITTIMRTVTIIFFKMMAPC